MVSATPLLFMPFFAELNKTPAELFLYCSYRRICGYKKSVENLFFLPICGIMIRVMKMDKDHVGAINDRPQRKKNRLENYDYSSCGAYFITACTLERQNYFWKNVGAIIDRPQDVELSTYGKMVDQAIQNIPSAYPALSLESYVIMPNHIHLLLRVCADEYGRPLVAPTMSRVVKQLKGIVSKQIGKSIWQKSFHDHIIRNREDYEEHLRYIYENPIRWCYDELYAEE